MRCSFTVVSIGIHSVVVAAAMLAQLTAEGALPTPHRPILFNDPPYMPIDIQLPQPHVGPSAVGHGEASINSAPIVAPQGVDDETGREAEPTRRFSGLVTGVETGSPASIEGVGVNGMAPPPPPPPEPTRPMRLHSGMKVPIKTTDVAPIYPMIAKSAHVEGVVILEAVLDARGHVASVHVLRSIPLLDQAAVDAVQQWHFTPALLNGEAVPVVMTVTVNFTLRDR